MTTRRRCGADGSCRKDTETMPTVSNVYDVLPRLRAAGIPILHYRKLGPTQQAFVVPYCARHFSSADTARARSHAFVPAHRDSQSHPGRRRQRSAPGGVLGPRPSGRCVPTPDTPPRRRSYMLIVSINGTLAMYGASCHGRHHIPEIVITSLVRKAVPSLLWKALAVVGKVYPHPPVTYASPVALTAIALPWLEVPK